MGNRGSSRVTPIIFCMARCGEDGSERAPEVSKTGVSGLRVLCVLPDPMRTGNSRVAHGSCHAVGSRCRNTLCARGRGPVVYGGRLTGVIHAEVSRVAEAPVACRVRTREIPQPRTIASDEARSHGGVHMLGLTVVDLRSSGQISGRLRTVAGRLNLRPSGSASITTCF